MKRKPYQGQDFSKETVLTQPNQALSLADIISRFSRNEPLEIGFDVSFHESDDDLEKLRRLDPVDRQAYIKKMQELQAKYQEQEAKRREKEEQKMRDEVIAKLTLEAEKKAREKASQADPAK